MNGLRLKIRFMGASAVLVHEQYVPEDIPQPRAVPRVFVERRAYQFAPRRQVLQRESNELGDLARELPRARAAR